MKRTILFLTLVGISACAKPVPTDEALCGHIRNLALAEGGTDYPGYYQECSNSLAVTKTMLKEETYRRFADCVMTANTMELLRYCDNIPGIASNP